MKIERLDRVAINVRSIEETQKFFSDLLGTKFEMSPLETLEKEEHVASTSDGTVFKGIAFSPIGLELIETSPPCKEEGLRSFHLKVSDIEEAKAEMKRKGVRLVAEFKHGGLKEAIFSREDLHGVRLVLVEYDAPNVISAIRQKGER